jgi:hypothetical protein
MSKATQIILDLLVDELKERIPAEFEKLGPLVVEKVKSSITDVKFDVNARLIVFKISNNHRWTHNEQQRFNDLKQRISEHLRMNNLDAMVVFINDDVDVQMLSDSDLRKMGLKRIDPHE